MKLAVSIDAKEAVKLGKNFAGWQVIEFDPADLTERQRAVLASVTTTTRPSNATVLGDLYPSQYGYKLSLAEPTVEALRVWLDSTAVTVDKREQEAADEVRRAAEQEQAVINELKTTATADLLVRSGNGWSLCGRLHNRRTLPELAETVERVQIEIDRREADEEAQRLATEKQKEEAREKMKNWGLEYGSELLKARIENGFEWIGLCREEYGAWLLRTVKALELKDASVPDDYDYDRADSWDTPTLSEMDALCAIRNLLPPDVNAQCRIVRVRYNPDEDYIDDPDAEAFYRTEFIVTVQLPDGYIYTDEYCL